MPKVVLLNIFAGQQVLGMKEEPLWTSDGGDVILVASKEGNIFAFSSGSQFILLGSFPAVNTTILALHHITLTDDIITLEKESDRSAITVCRVYSNWRSAFASADVITTESSHQVTTSTLPIPSSIQQLAVCKDSARLLVATETNLSLWQLDQSWLEEVGTCVQQHQQLFDFDIPYHSQRKLAISLDYIAYTLGCEVVVLRFALERSNEQGELEGVNETDEKVEIREAADAVIWNAKDVDSAVLGGDVVPIEEDAYFVRCMFDHQLKNPTLHYTQHSSVSSETRKRLAAVEGEEEDDNNNAEERHTAMSREGTYESAANKGPSFAVGQPMPSLLMPQRTESAKDQLFVQRGPIPDIDHDLRVNTDLGFVVSKWDLMLRKQFPKGTEGCVHSLLLRSERKFSISSSNNQTGVSAMACWISTPQNGFLYNVMEKISLVAEYTYTMQATQAYPSTNFLYVITQDGLETWTLPPCSSVGEEEKSVTPVLVAMLPYISLKSITLTESAVLLLSKFKEGEELVVARSRSGSLRGRSRSGSGTSPMRKTLHGVSSSSAEEAQVSWSLYVLQPKPVATLYSQLLDKAKNNENGDEEVYLQLLLEGHYLLEARLSELRSHLAGDPDTCDPAVKLSMELEFSNVMVLLQNSSSLIAEHYLHHAKDYMKCAKFFALSDQPLQAVVQNLINKKGAEMALIHYLDSVLFSPEAGDDEPSEMLSDTILEHYRRHAPHRLSSVILESSLQTYSQEVALALLEEVFIEAPHNRQQQQKERNSLTRRVSSDSHSVHSAFQTKYFTRNTFARALIYLDLGRVEEAVQALVSIDSKALIRLCLKHHSLLLPLHGEDANGEAFEVALTAKEFADPSVSAAAAEGVSSPFISIFEGSNVSASPALAALLREHMPWVLLESLLSLSDATPFHVVLSTLYPDPSHLLLLHFRSISSSSPTPAYDLNSFVLTACYLEETIIQASENLSARRHHTSFKHLTQLEFCLLDIYILILAGMAQRKRQRRAKVLEGGAAAEQRLSGQHLLSIFYLPHSGSLGEKWKQKHEHAFLASRPAWLDLCFPEGALYVDEEAEAVVEEQDAEGMLDPESLIYVKKFQSLVCNRTFEEGVCDHLLTMLANFLPHEAHFLKPICLAATPRIEEAIPLLLEQQPKLAISFGQHYCQRVPVWRSLVDTLQQLLFRAAPKENEPPSQQYNELQQSYSALWHHLSERLTPDLFLALLPGNGRMSFFLPLLERCFQYHRAQQVKHIIGMQAMETSAAVSSSSGEWRLR